MSPYRNSQLKTSISMALLLTGSSLFVTPNAVAAPLTLTFCGVLDNSPDDLDPTDHRVSLLHCLVNAFGPVVNPADATGSLDTATAREFVRQDSDQILVGGFARGAGMFEVSNDYPFRSGHGDLGTSIGGQLEGPVGGKSLGTEFITGIAGATSFSNNFAMTSFTPAPGRSFPIPFQTIPNVKEGLYSGPGTLIGTLEWDTKVPFVPLGGAETLQESEGIASTAEFVAAVPEPSMIFLLCFGLAIIAANVHTKKIEKNRKKK